MHSVRHFFKVAGSDIRLWLVVLFCIRLWGITHPPLDANHGWRQAQTCMMARNLFETDANPLYPRIDQSGGDHSGIVASELPVLPWLMYVVSLLFGYECWYGRLINLVVTTWGLWCFYRLAVRWLNQRVAFYSTLVLSVSVWFMFARKVMPDTFSMSLMLAALWQGSRFLDTGRWQWLVLFTALGTLAVLAKLPAVALLALVPLWWCIRGPGSYRMAAISFSAILISMSAYGWYFMWLPYLLKEGAMPIMFVQHFSEGVKSFIPLWKETLHKVYFETTQSYILFAFSLAGLVLAFKTNRKFALALLWLSLPVLFFFIKAGAHVIAFHNYYMIPLAPIPALAAGYAASQLQKKKWVVLLIAAGVVESLANQHHDLRYPKARAYKLRLEQLVNTNSPAGSTIAIVCDQNPTEFYCAHRRGWMLNENEAADRTYLQQLAQRGCALLIVNRHIYPMLKSPLEVASQDDDYTLFRMPAPVAPAP